MSTVVQPIVVSSKEDLYSRLEEVANTQKRDSIVGIRGLRLSEEEQLQLAKDLGDITGWYPNNSDKFNHKYIENHGTNSKVEGSDGDEVILAWHLERIDYDMYIPLVAGVWNMRKFRCDKESGKTYFIDSRKLYDKIFSKSEKEFLRGVIAVYEARGLTHYVKIVQNHWNSAEEMFRAELLFLPHTKVHTVLDREPTEEESALFSELVYRFEKEVYENEELRIIHKWEEGDILIPDLHCLAHAVTGGFDPKDREFTGFWCYLDSPSAVPDEKIPPTWDRKNP